MQELDARGVEPWAYAHARGGAQVVGGQPPQARRGRPPRAVAVEIGAEGELVERFDRPVDQRGRRRRVGGEARFEDAQVGAVDRERGRAVGVAAEGLGQAHEGVVGAAVGGPEGARKGLVA